MKIWLSMCDAPWAQSAFVRQTAYLSIQPIETLGNDAPQNIQTVTIGVGNAFFHVHHTVATVQIDPQFNRWLFAQIWPVVGDPLFWPPIRSLTELEARSASEVLIRLAKNPKVKVVV
jgi:hypothetical protein